MSTATHEPPELEDGQYHPYRAVSKAAVLSLAFALGSLVVLLHPIFLFLPVLGIFFALFGLANIKRYPQELTGRATARIALILAAVLLVGGATRHAYIYATEVPEGYARISFTDLQPTDEAPHWPVSPKALELNGKKVFIKGYVYPDGQQYNIKHFVMVRDLGTCCFGGQPKMTHMMEVRLQDPNRVEYAMRKRKLGGVLRVNPMPKQIGKLGGVIFELDADYVR